MQELSEVIDFYKNDNIDKNKIIYQTFEKNIKEYPALEKQHDDTPGFGELSFSWSWFLLVKSMPSTFTFLEIGVYKGRVLALIQLLSNIFNKHVNIDKLIIEYGTQIINNKLIHQDIYSNILLYTLIINKDFEYANIILDKSKNVDIADNHII